MTASLLYNRWKSLYWLKAPVLYLYLYWFHLPSNVEVFLKMVSQLSLFNLLCYCYYWRIWVLKKHKIWMFKRRKESDTYLATVRSHHWSRQIMMKIDKIGAFSQHCGFRQLKRKKAPIWSIFIVICLLQRCLRTVAR
jgi:hypothetical protein